MRSALTILRQYWQYDAFRPMQEEIINAVLGGKDVLALLPTGGGKSLCFQVPAMAQEGLCLVVSPLIALMKDQVENLRRKNITAYAIFSGMSRKELITTLKVAGESNCKFLYVSPERLETSLFKEYLPSLGVNLLAVDEAHCISQWGYDFRPPYLRIAALREELPGVPVLALTASATREVQRDICEKLLFQNPAVFRQSFKRDNLSFSVFRVDSKIVKVREILQKVAGSAIVYCGSRRKTREISDTLRMHGISADFYHAGLKQEERTERQDNWKENKTRVIVCTNAFGMGIDKPDVRIVIHADLPDCLENYYQEAGRAGRDGKKAYAVLLYTEPDLAALQQLSAVRFPGLPDIRMVYQALVNYLQVPVGGGEDQYYDFDIADFTKKFQLDILLSSNVLKVLEQEEILSYNEQVMLPARAGFICSKDRLYEFEKENPSLEPLIKTLLRTYSGIFDQPVPIHEKTIAWLLKREIEEITRDLKTLHLAGIMVYEPKKDNPQLYLIQPRQRAEDLAIRVSRYEERKKQFESRAGSMLQYIKKQQTCRSQFIARYFGDDDTTPCGVCDNCLRRNKVIVSREEFEQIHQRILELIGATEIPANELLQKLSGIHKEKMWKVINYLQAENKLEVDGQGMVRGKG